MTAPCSDIAATTLVVPLSSPAWATATHCAWNSVTSVHSPLPNALHSFNASRLAFRCERIELLMKVSPRESIATPTTVCAQFGRLLYYAPAAFCGMGEHPCTPWPPMGYMPCGQLPSAKALSGSMPAISSSQ